MAHRQAEDRLARDKAPKRLSGLSAARRIPFRGIDAAQPNPDAARPDADVQGVAVEYAADLGRIFADRGEALQLA